MSAVTDPVAKYELIPIYDFYVVETFKLWNQKYGERSEVNLRISKLHKSGDGTRLVMTFYGVRELEYIPLSKQKMSSWPLSILSIRSKKSEDSNFQVSDTEMEDDLSFVCRDFTAVIRKARRPL